VDIVDKAPVTFLAKNSVHTRVVADDDVVIGGCDTRPGFSAYGNIIARVSLFWSARLPMAVLLAPVVLALSASEPMAVLESPVALFMSAK
jgi:hypothetical protein